MSRAADRPGRIMIGPLRLADVEPCAQMVARDPLWRRYQITLRGARRLIRRAYAARRRGGRIAREVGVVAVARWRGGVAGFIWFRPSGTFHHSGYVRWVAVAPRARGRGIGARLMRHAERRIFAEGPNVFLLVSDFNTGAQAFYRKLGYRQVGAIPAYVVAGVTERLYRKARGPIAAGRRG